ncbi:MAG TPA: TonB-dependent receptor, partial [Pseudomonadota bacterium]|nr:TonB-dependent receptor [Pseudomonadota bacterium]
ADLLDVSAMLSGAAGPRLRLLAAGRYSYLDRLLSALSRPDLGDYFPLPQYWDAQAQAQLALPAGARLRATILASGDTTVRAHALGEPGQVQRETGGATSYRLGLHYERPSNGVGDGAGGLQLAPWLGLDRRSYDAHFGGQDTARLSDDWLYGLRASHRQTLYSRRPGLSISLSLGGDLLGRYAQVSRTGTLSRPARDETGVVFGQPPGLLVNSDAWSVHLLDVALYAVLGLRLGQLSVEAGLRGGGVLSDVSRLLPRGGDSPPLGGRQIEAQLAPRLQAALQAHRTLRLSLAGGLYQQPPSPSDLSAVFGRPRLGSSRAMHLTAASSFSPHPRLQIELAGYLRLLDRLVAASPLPTPPLASALTGDGSGRAYGGQIRLQLSEATLGRGRWAPQLSGWLGYSLSRSERREAPTAPTLPSLYDQTHSLQATARLALRRLSAALRLQYTTGQPRPAVLGSYYNAWTDQDEPLLDPLGSARLPEFLQLDLRLEYTFLLPAGLRLSTQLEIQNLTNHPNVQELAYSADWQSAAPITGLPTLAVLGLRVSR